MAYVGTGVQPREQTAVSRRRLSFFAQLHKPTQVLATPGLASQIPQAGHNCGRPHNPAEPSRVMPSYKGSSAKCMALGRCLTLSV